MMRLFFSLFIVLIFQSCAFQSEDADLILHNAKIYSMDQEFNVYQAMAIKDGKIIALGPEREILNKYSAKQTLDCRKQIVYPGFIDAHCHFLAYGLMLQDADLKNAKSFDEVIQRLKEHSKSSTFPWIIGRGWDQNLWENKSFPDRAKLDSLFPNTPVYLTRIDGHAVLVNQTALERANINPTTQVEGGSVEVVNGRCTGVLIDNAIALVDAHMPQRTKQEKVDALMRAQEKCFAVGLTTVDEAGLLKSEVELIDSLQKAGQLKMRVYTMLSDNQENFDYYLPRGIDTTSERLTIRSFKLYADGALGSRGACVLSPYEDLLPMGRKEYGKLLSNVNHYREAAAQLYKHGFQMNTHAIGDSANRVILDIYGDVLMDVSDSGLFTGHNDLRWRIEHAQVVHEADAAKFAKYSIIPSVQPTHATSDGAWAWERLGRNRVKRAYIYRELLDLTGLLALGTDFPIEDISPIGTYYSAVFRKKLDGWPEGGYQMENALNPRQALYGMTLWAAISNFEDHRKGSLEVGKYADITVLDRDILEVGEEEVVKTEVRYTILGGEIVYVRP